MKCKAHNRNGEPCGKDAIPGGFICARHGVNADYRADAEVRAGVMNWQLGDTTLDPGEVLLRLVSQSSRRCEMYAGELDRLVAENGESLTDALTSPIVQDGRTVGEFAREMVRLEERERDRCSTMAAKAIAAGLAERLVRLAENQAAEIARIIAASVDAAGLDEVQRQAVITAAATELRAISG